MAQRDGNAWQPLVQYLANFQFVRGINNRPKQSYRNGFNTEFFKALSSVHHVIAVKSGQYASARINAFAHGLRQMSRHISLGIIQSPLKRTLARALAQNQNILMTFCDDQANLDRFTLYQSIGRNSRTMHNEIDLF